MLDEPLTNKDYIYHYRDGPDIEYMAHHIILMTNVEVTGQIVAKIYFSHKYSELIN